jgi:hypothetical protein
MHACRLRAYESNRNRYLIYLYSDSAISNLNLQIRKISPDFSCHPNFRNSACPLSKFDNGTRGKFNERDTTSEPLINDLTISLEIKCC